MISPELLRAYQETDYIVLSDEAGGADGRFAMTIGIASLPLMSLYKRHDARCAAFVTAFNPRSRLETGATNSARQARLHAWIQARGFFFLDGMGCGRMGTWPCEPSFLVLAMTREQAGAVGRMYDQNAVVWCGPDAVPQLVPVDAG